MHTMRNIPTQVISGIRAFNNSTVQAGTFIYNGAGPCKDESLLKSLSKADPDVDMNRLKREKGDRAAGTCEWILETSELKEWLDTSIRGTEYNPNFLWLHGPPGTGKSTMAIAMVEEIRTLSYPWSGNNTLSYFFCDSGSEDHNTAISILRGLLYLLVKQRPPLMKFLLPKYKEREEEYLQNFDALWMTLIEIGDDTASGHKYCIIDGLDECDRASQEILLAQISETFGRKKQRKSGLGIHLLVTSRSNPEISRVLRRLNSKNLSSYKEQLNHDLISFIGQQVTTLSTMNNYTKRITRRVSDLLQAKSQGTFLWVGIACKELAGVRSRDVLKKLEELPQGLQKLYQKLLDTTLPQGNGKDDQTIREILYSIVVAQRPLSVSEIAVACQLYVKENEKERFQFTREDIENCRLTSIDEHDVVRLLHSSVRDFLVENNGHTFVSKLHASMAQRCIDHFLLCCLRMTSVSHHFKMELFDNYSVTYWPRHAALAGSEFTIANEHNKFFQPTSDEWNTWVQAFNSLTFTKIPMCFTPYHIAARWNIPKLVELIAPSLRGKRSNDERSRSGRLHDSEFRDKRGVSPLQEAARNSNKDVFQSLLERVGKGGTVRRGVVIAACESACAEDLLKLLLDPRKFRIRITKSTIQAAVESICGNSAFAEGALKLLLAHYKDWISITAGVVEAAAENENHGEEIMKLLCTEDIQITAQAKLIIVRRFSKDTVMLLFSHYTGQSAERIPHSRHGLAPFLDQSETHQWFTKEVIKAARQNIMHGAEILEYLLDQSESHLSVTESMMVDAAGNKFNTLKATELLLKQGRTPALVTESVVKAAVQNTHHGEKILSLLLQRQQGPIPVTENVIRAAVENINCGDKIIQIFLAYFNNEMPITESVLKAAARNKSKAAKILDLLLNQCKNQVPITKSVLEAAASNIHCEAGTMALLLKHHNEPLLITEDMVLALTRIRNSQGANQIMRLFLQHGCELGVKEDAITRALWFCDCETVKVLCSKIERVTISMVAAVLIKLHSVENELIELLMKHCKGTTDDIENIVQAAVINEFCPYEIIVFLLRRYKDEAIITENVIQAAVRNSHGKAIVPLLLQHDRPVSITENVIKAAAENLYCGDKLTMILLEYSNTAPITENIMKAAAKNSCCGDEIIRTLLKYSNNQAPVTTTVLKAAVQNERCGSTMLELLLPQCQGKLLITRGVIRAAKKNQWGGKEILKLLLQQQHLKSTNTIGVSGMHKLTREDIKIILANPQHYKQIARELTMAFKRHGWTFEQDEDKIYTQIRRSIHYVLRTKWKKENIQRLLLQINKAAEAARRS